jgi:insulysin
LSWELPPDLLIAGPQLTWDWAADGSDVKRLHEYLDSFRPTEGRVVLMAKKEEHEKLDANQRWQQEPVYGTGFSVKTFDEGFVKEVSI